MLKWAAEFIGGKVLTAVLAVAAVLVGIYFWRHPEALQGLWRVVKLALAWMAFAAVLPWGLFFVPPAIMKLESNWAAGLMLGGYILLDVVAGLWLAGWSVDSTLGWMVLILGFLAAGVYNFLVCDFLADRADEF